MIAYRGYECWSADNYMSRLRSLITTTWSTTTAMFASRTERSMRFSGAGRRGSIEASGDAGAQLQRRYSACRGRRGTRPRRSRLGACGRHTPRNRALLAAAAALLETETLNEPDIERLKQTIVRDGPGPATLPTMEAAAMSAGTVAP
jgi:hypothetical protein